MCGIAGIFNFKNQQTRLLPHVLSMTKAMRNRGPDDEGFIACKPNGQIDHFIGEETPNEVRSKYPKSKLITRSLDFQSTLVMGHRRLSILDLSPAGHQPMCNSNGRDWIVFNGEIYNFKDVRSELKNLGYSFTTGTDTEVILAAYSHWNDGCLSRFNGDFSFVIWDNQTQSLFCARDRIGIKPFYFLLDENRFIFGSDIKTIIASGLYYPEPDPHGLYLAMAFGIAPRPITAFKGIFALEQAHWMRIYSTGKFEKHRYWKIPTGNQNAVLNEIDARRQLDEKLQKAVELRLIADVPVGTFMSGGIDSSTISAIAAKKHPGIKAFTLGYQDDVPEMDEVAQATSTAKMWPMTHIIHKVDPNDTLQYLDEWIRGYEEPFYNIAANYVISKLVRKNNTKVVLNGLGGDELFSGYSYYRYHTLPRIPRLGFLFNKLKWLPSNKIRRRLNMVGAESPDMLHTMIFRQQTDEVLDELFQQAFRPPVDTLKFLHELYCGDVNFCNTMEAFNYMDLMNYIGNHHVHRVDQFTMAHSVEGRFPFLDHELVEFAFTIPPKLKIFKGQRKYILRKVAQNYISKDCLSMQKKGFGLPLKHWMQNQLKQTVTNSIKLLCQRNEINADKIQKMFQAYEQDKLIPQRIWHLVALEKWFEEFIDPGVHLLNS